MRFVDEVVITVRSGKGGSGAVSFLRGRFEPLGGPDGGDGGRGGNVIVVADSQVGTLLDFRYNRHRFAEDGKGGAGRQKTGRSAESKRIRVPVGTIVLDDETGEEIADLSADGAEVIVAKGGRGGKGNIHFKSSTNQAPRYAEPGEPAEERRIRLTLKLLADVGLVGYPNAGKSTLISRVSAAHPKIADYAFTTLTPNLGIVRTDDERSFCIADIPGLIPGASEGAGLGTRFLKHIERVAALAIVLDVSAYPDRHPVTDYEVLVKELGAYSPSLLEKPRVMVLNKIDLEDTQAAVDDVRALAEREGVALFLVSSVRGDGLDPLVLALQAIVDEARAAREPPPEDEESEND